MNVLTATPFQRAMRRFKTAPSPAAAHTESGYSEVTGVARWRSQNTEPRVSRAPAFRLSKDVAQRFNAYATAAFPYEIGGLLRVQEQEDGSWLAVDVRIFRQAVTPAYFELNGAAVAEFNMNLFKEGKKEELPEWRSLIHSHPDMTPFMSGPDRENIERLAGERFAFSVICAARAQPRLNYFAVHYAQGQPLALILHNLEVKGENLAGIADLNDEELALIEHDVASLCSTTGLQGLRVCDLKSVRDAAPVATPVSEPWRQTSHSWQQSSSSLLVPAAAVSTTAPTGGYLDLEALSDEDLAIMDAAFQFAEEDAVMVDTEVEIWNLLTDGEKIKGSERLLLLREILDNYRVHLEDENIAEEDDESEGASEDESETSVAALVAIDDMIEDCLDSDGEIEDDGDLIDGGFETEPLNDIEYTLIDEAVGFLLAGDIDDETAAALEAASKGLSTNSIIRSRSQIQVLKKALAAYHEQLDKADPGDLPCPIEDAREILGDYEGELKNCLVYAYNARAAHTVEAADTEGKALLRATLPYCALARDIILAAWPQPAARSNLLEQFAEGDIIEGREAINALQDAVEERVRTLIASGGDHNDELDKLDDILVALGNPELT